MSIAFVGTSGIQTSGTTTQTLSYPTGIQAGDLTVVALNSDNGTISVPSGWNQLNNQSSNVEEPLYLYRFYASGDGSSVSFTSTGSLWNGSYLVTYRGVSTLTPFTAGGIAGAQAASSISTSSALYSTNLKTGTVVLSLVEGYSNGTGAFTGITYTAPSTTSTATRLASVNANSTNFCFGVAELDIASSTQSLSDSWATTGPTGPIMVVRALMLTPIGGENAVAVSTFLSSNNTPVYGSAVTSLALQFFPAGGNAYMCVGNIAIVTVVVSSGVTITPPAGFTQVATGNVGTSATSWVYSYSITPADASINGSPSYTFAFSAATDAVLFFGIGGSVNATNPVASASVNVYANTATLGWPSVSATTSQTLLLHSVSYNASLANGNQTIDSSLTPMFNAGSGAEGYYETFVPTASGAQKAFTATNSVTSESAACSVVVLNPGQSAPNAPTLTSPTNASYDDVSNGITFSGIYNPAVSGNTLTGVQLRIKTSSASSYSYWNASTGALQTTAVTNSVSGTISSGQSFSESLPAGVLSDGNVDNWSFACQDQGGLGPFASDFTFTAQAPPSVAVNLPAGTVGSATTQASWTDTLPSGASQTAYRIVVYTSVQYQAIGFTPGSGPNVYDSGVVSSSATQTTVSGLPNNTTCRAYVQVTETGGQTSAWSYSTFTVTFDTPAAPTLTAAPATDSNGTPYIGVTIQGHDNIVSAADASFEGSLGTWGAGSGAAPSLTTEAALDGAYSMAITVTGGTQQRVFEAAANNPVAPGVTYTVMASFRPVSATRSMAVLFETFDGTNTYQGVAGSTTVTETAGAWVTAIFQATTPAGAATGRIQLGWATDVGTLPLGAPTGLAVTTATTGGSIGASVTRYYEVTGVNAYGQTTASAEVTVTTGSTTSTNANTLTWTALSGATSYNVYAATASGSEQLLASGVTTTSYTDTAATLPTGATPPTTDTTGERHDVDLCGIFPGTVTSWTRGGLAGIGSATVTYTDANNTTPVTLRNTPVTLPTPSQQVVVADYEATPGVARTYVATVSATV